MKMNLPNRLTIIRMVLTPLFLFVFLSEFIPYHYALGLFIYIVGCFTDYLDGKIARKYNLITVFGQLADPVADKMLTTAALLVLMSGGYCSIYIVFLVLTREFAVTSVRLAASAQGVVIPANIWGKLKTVSQMVFTIAVMLGITLQGEGLFPDNINLRVLSEALLWITAILATVSGIIYVKNGAKLIDFNKK